ncbi:MAG: SDR family NAD(P)-dependent oxidoreductase [Verrucomicrobia bacterium]|nr:SDR family NAD(P)-dependent oxidoreductase [Verrucomicrobiota bacterium]
MNRRKLALVTGGNRGIGRELVHQLLLKEFQVVLTCRNIKDGEAVVEALDGPVDQLTALIMDVSDDESVMLASKSFGERFDRLDVLVNNAGILLDEAESILTVSEDILNQTWNTNSLGALRVTRAFLPYLKNSDDPRVINVSSLAGQLKDMGSWAPAYSISKTALNAVTCLLSNDLAQFNIKVNSVSPGWIKTDMGGPTAPGTLEEGTDTIVWLAEEAPAELTGSFLRDREPADW